MKDPSPEKGERGRETTKVMETFWRSRARKALSRSRSYFSHLFILLTLESIHRTAFFVRFE